MIKYYFYMFCFWQHQRRRNGKINMAAFINMFYKDNPDYCLEVWVERTIYDANKNAGK